MIRFLIPAIPGYGQKKVTKDSMIFQVMQVETNVIYLLRSNVYMTFYADDYIKKKKLDLATLQKTDRLDTAFVRQRSELANTYSDTIFAGHEPVVLKSKSPLLTVEKVKVERTRENHYDTSDSYMYPEYNITIDKAYQNFSYWFTAVVDTKGQIHFKRSLVNYVDYKDLFIRNIKGIIDGYLKAYLAVTPGSTLGITHNTVITLNVVGKKK